MYLYIAIHTSYLLKHHSLHMLVPIQRVCAIL